MIIELRGDLLRSDCSVIMHQANCFATMGAGIAKQIQRKYPRVLHADKNYSISIGSRKRLGRFSKSKEFDGVTVYNLYGQFHYGRGKQTNEEAFGCALYEAIKDVKLNCKDNTKIGLPYGIGCGLAGGNWSMVYGIIEDTARRLNVTIYLYRL